ncbi:uroporphyrinogen-III C-methyltransferase [Aureimonas fodinaquatilis]|uniref:Uroporphyrinogen-III C-methyltransferase n=2 Tax=Aureimonas fodinaquatilis TaxID=2565783 RepID=A0A5B0E0I3_9HYPH|nr:uroporphyrinogen-III C-methyltransferase [Aureimonas fodinaquatilis]
MGNLASLPVFFDLTGKRAIVVGGANASAWKAELLAAAGAKVELYAAPAELSVEMHTVLSNDYAGSIQHRSRDWRDAEFEGAAMAVADFETNGEAERFVKAATQAGVPVNIIDKPEFCQFRFGTIVNRSPVVIGIATDGAAPILGQAIRRRIETLLPHALSDWAALAARLRGEVMARLQPGPQRRAFWEKLSDMAFTRRVPNAQQEAELHDLVESLHHTQAAQGRVTLVGAGPGDAELLTLKAVRALQAADVILFDDLVSDEVLELARREARRMLVGKRAGRDSCRQEDINRTMVQLALAGKHVVRLKGGDVSVFGRSGEEIAELKQRGIPVSIVPGITAASAMAAGFGVSLTHRDHAQQVRLVTGHSRKGGLPQDVDWKALAGSNATTIFYMGGRMAAQISAQLQQEGMAASTPVAIAANISREDEARNVGTLAQLPELVAAVGLDRPILIGVGQVFAQCLAVQPGNWQPETDLLAKTA